MVLVLLAAAVLRLLDLQGVPPGIEHDEVANWLIDREILAGRHAIYFTQAYGHEAGYHYVQAAAVALFGDHALSLRLPSAFAGLLGIAISYALAKKLFSEPVALVSAAVLASLFWSIFFSRLGVRAILLPAVSGLAAYFFWRGLTGEPKQLRHLGLAGVLAGASLYTYMAARTVPLIFLAFLLYLALVDRPLLRVRWRGLLLFFVLMVLVATPLLIWLQNHPGSEFRIGEIDQPLTALRAGDARPVWENGLKLLGFFGWQGDPLVRQNIPGRPVFDPLGALLFYSGLLIALWRWRRPEVGFLLIWLLVSLTPSLVTADAPSSIRCINALVVVGVLAGLAVEFLLDKFRKRRILMGLVLLWCLLSAAWTVRDYFFRWPQEAEVEFVWQIALQEAAAMLDADPSQEPVVLGGWTPESMDPPSMELLLKRDDLALRYVDPTQALILPQGGGRMVWPAALPMAAELMDYLAKYGVQSREIGRITWVDLPVFTANGQDFVWHQVAFEGNVSLLGYQLLSLAEGLSMITFWQASGPLDEPLAVFVHLAGADGQIAGQYDGLGAPAAHWQSGDIIVVLCHISVPAGEYLPRLGLYNPETGLRLHYYWPAVGMVDTLVLERVIVP